MDCDSAEESRPKGGCGQDWPMPHTFCNSNIQAPTPQRLRHPTGPNSLLEGRRTGEKPATNSVGCNAIDEHFEPAFFASQKVCGISQDWPPHTARWSEAEDGGDSLGPFAQDEFAE